MTQPCRYFAMGSCMRGNECFFKHERPKASAATNAEDNSNVCRFYLRGECNFGSKCRYDHVKPKMTVVAKALVNPVRSVPATATPTTTTTTTTTMSAPVIVTRNFEDHASPSWIQQAASAATEASRLLECCVCLEVVLLKEKMSARRFGILPGCNHCCCLDCLRRWRGTNDAHTARLCPICRTESHFVVPSAIWPDSPELKQQILDGYKAKLSETHCKYFNQGEGECPFGTSCFYKHAYPDGTLEDRRVRTYADGEALLVHRAIKLWDFISAWNEEQNHRQHEDEFDGHDDID